MTFENYSSITFKTFILNFAKNLKKKFLYRERMNASNDVSQAYTYRLKIWDTQLLIE